MILNVKENDLLESGVLTADELAFRDNLRIPYKDASDLWMQKEIIDKKVSKAIEDGVVKPVEHSFEVRRAAYVISDDLGMHGLKNQADGKMYDSKSNLYKSYRAGGFEVVGNDPIPDKPREQRGDYDCRADVARAIEQVGGIK